MTDVAGRFFVGEEITDALGSGLRIHNDTDAVYEAREQPDAGIRLYTAADTGEWLVTVRKPFADTNEAYSRFRETGDAVEEFYDTVLPMEQDEFNYRKENGQKISLSDYPWHVSVNWKHDVDFPEKRLFKIPYYFMPMSYSFGEGAGFVVGTALHQPELAPIAYLGGALLPFAGWAGPKGGEIYRNRRTREKIQQVDALEDEVFAHVNELHRLEGLREVQEHTNYIGDDKEERQHELEKQQPRDELETLMNIQFHEFDRLKGVTATTIEPTYEDAVTFAAVTTGVDPSQVPDETPSIYQDADVYRQLLAETTAESDVDEATYLVPAGKELIRTALAKNTSVAINTYLETHHGDVLDEVGIDYAIGGDA